MAGALASARVSEDVLMLAFAALMLLVGALMLARLRRPAPADDDRTFAEPVITFSPTFTWNWPAAIKMIESGELPLDEICTHQYGLSDFQQALDQVGDSSGASIKVSILPGA